MGTQCGQTGSWGYRITSDVNKEGWEKATFPILCETCLGDNPYVRMQKEDFGTECKICVRPFTVFRWKAGTKGRYKSTIVCQSCARMKNVCQTCLFDLEFGLPVQVRDKYMEEASMGSQEAIQTNGSRVNRDYALAEAEKLTANNELPYGKVAAHPMLQRLARTTPYYKRNEARICTFFTKGQCNRGHECPFRHEIPEGGPLATQRIRDRYHGENDPVAEKMFARAEEQLTLQPPEDKSVTCLYIGGLESGTKDKDVRDQFYLFGEVKSVRIVPKQSAAFVTFTTRDAAEEAVKKLYRNLTIKGKKASVMWGKPQLSRAEQAAKEEAERNSAAAMPAIPGMPPTMGAFGAFKPYYPSMDPSAQGNAPLQGEAPDDTFVPKKLAQF